MQGFSKMIYFHCLLMLVWKYWIEIYVCSVQLVSAFVRLQDVATFWYSPPLNRLCRIPLHNRRNSTSMYFSPFCNFHTLICRPCCHKDELVVHSAGGNGVASPANLSLVRTTNRKSPDWQRHKTPAPYDWKY